MSEQTQITGIMISYGNEAVRRAFKRLGIPLSVYQKLTLSDDWKAEQKAEAVEKVKQIKPSKTEKANMK